jgi:hypothetical protein
VSEEVKKPSEFRRYRQILTGAYLVLAASVVVLLTASVVADLFFHRPPGAKAQAAISVEQPDPDELLECHDLVFNLMTALGSETTRLLALPVGGGRGELASLWEDFSRAWLDDWDVAEARCRFSELAGTHLGVAFDRLAKVHGDLPLIRLKYESLLDGFGEELAAELADMRHALDLSHDAFQAMREKARASSTL